MLSEMIRHRREFIRAVHNRHFELTPAGILFPEQKAIWGGVFESWVNDADHQVDANIIPTEGLNLFLLSTVTGGTVVSPWYMGLGAANVTPLSTLTGATTDSALTEFVAYAEGARVAYVPAAPSAGATDNGASRAVFTINGGGGNAYTAFLHASSTWHSGTGPVLCAAKFSPARTGLAAGDALAVKYTLSLTST